MKIYGDSSAFSDSSYPDWNSDDPGEQIMSWVHNHPVTSGVDERFPSTPVNSHDGQGDIGEAHNLISQGAADQNTILYIIDDKSGGVFEYGVNDGITGTSEPDMTSDQDDESED